MTLEAYQAYMNFWYAQTQAQMPAGQMPYPIPPPTTHAQPSTQPGLKLSKLVKEARLLGCQTFSETVDDIVAKNWIKKISDTMVNMELDDTLKLKVATRLLDQSATTWWENFKLRTSVPIISELFVREFNDQYYTHFHRDQKQKEFFKLRQWGKSVIEYEIKLRQLAEFVLKMARSEEYLCSKFEEGLNRGI